MTLRHNYGIYPYNNYTADFLHLQQKNGENILNILFLGRILPEYCINQWKTGNNIAGNDWVAEFRRSDKRQIQYPRQLGGGVYS